MEIEEEPTTYRIERQEEEDDLNPPFVIIVQGSKDSGKTTLIKSLVQHFTR
jgi:ribosome biogenesis protein BMS1